jgi:steroid delta-isomerase-like uncharacterized protein
MAETQAEAKAPVKKAAAKKPARPRRSPKVKAVYDVAESYFAAVTARDPKAMAAHWHEDGIEDIVPLGVFRGPAAVQALFEEMFAAIPDFTFTVDRITADAEVASVQWRAHGNFTGTPFRGIEATGRRVDLRGCDCVEVVDGKLARNTAYYDGAAFARSIGLLPPENSGADKAMLAGFNAVTKLRRTIGAQTGGNK